MPPHEPAPDPAGPGAAPPAHGLRHARGSPSRATTPPRWPRSSPGLGVGKGVFYWYFASKEELFLEILREAQHGPAPHASSRPSTDVDDPVRRIELGHPGVDALVGEHRDLFNLFPFAATEERFAPALRKGQEIAVADAMRHVQDGIDRGRASATAIPSSIAHAILGVTGQLARAFIHERGDDWPDVADAAVAFCLEGLLVPIAAAPA